MGASTDVDGSLGCVWDIPTCAISPTGHDIHSLQDVTDIPLYDVFEETSSRDCASGPTGSDRAFIANVCFRPVMVSSVARRQSKSRCLSYWFTCSFTGSYYHLQHSLAPSLFDCPLRCMRSDFVLAYHGNSKERGPVHDILCTINADAILPLSLMRREATNAVRSRTGLCAVLSQGQKL